MLNPCSKCMPRPDLEWTAASQCERAAALSPCARSFRRSTLNSSILDEHQGWALTLSHQKSFGKETIILVWSTIWFGCLIFNEKGRYVGTVLQGMMAHGFSIQRWSTWPGRLILCNSGNGGHQTNTLHSSSAFCFLVKRFNEWCVKELTVEDQWGGGSTVLSTGETGDQAVLTRDEHMYNCTLGDAITVVWCKSCRYRFSRWRKFQKGHKQD